MNGWQSLVGLLLLGSAFTPAKTIANPVPVGLGYITSEQLAIQISPTNAEFAGTFIFRSLGYTNGRYWELQVSMWYPDSSTANQSVSKFWQTFRPEDQNRVSERRCLDLAKNVMLSLAVGQETFAPKSVSRRMSWSEIITLKGKTKLDSQFGDTFKEGFRELVFSFQLPATLLEAGLPVKISYRHPLLNLEDGGHFFYVPYFDFLPKEATVNNTNHYAVVLSTTPNCSLMVTNGYETYTLRLGQRLTLSPRHFQPIQAVALPTSQRY